MNAQNKSFEKQWADAFENAELTPSEGVWNKVELAVAKSSNAANEKRIFFFKLLAAASITFAAVIGLGALYTAYYDKSETFAVSTPADDFSVEQLEDGNNNMSSISEDNIKKDNESLAYHEISKDNVAEVNQSKTGDKTITIERSDVNQKLTNSPVGSSNTANDRSEKETFVGALTDYQATNENQTLILNEENSVAWKDEISSEKNLTILERIGLDLAMNTPDRVEFKMVPWYSYASGVKKENNTKTLWTGLSMSAGSFNPNSGSSSESVSLNSALQDSGNPGSQYTADAIRIGEERPGVSYGVGFNFGAQLSTKVVLVTGLNYLQQTTSSSSNVVGDGSVVSNFNEVASSENVSVTNQYEIENTYQSISLPIQAGYYLLNRRFGIMMLAGFSNDFFVRRNSTDETGVVSSEDFGSGQDGYSLYSVGGLLGTQFSYQIGENYTIALQPQFKQNLNSFAPNLERPSSFEVGFRFNYRLK